MRSNQKNNRSRGRGNNNNNNRNKSSNPLTRSYDSNGPDVRVRGNASTVAEKYLQLARDAHLAGDSVAAENYFQHAEHYHRIISAAQAQQLAQQQAQQAAQAARAEQHNHQGNRPENKQENAPEGGTPQESSLEEKPVVTESSSEAVTEQKTASDRPQRERRPRRRPLPEKKAAPEKSGDDPASAPQPDVSELPAFVTAEADTSAAE